MTVLWLKMSGWKFLLVALAVIALLWFLNPERAIKRNEPGIVEIVYLGESGPEAASVEEAMREFEAQSQAAHEENPAHPITKSLKARPLRAIRPLIQLDFSLASPVEDRRI